MLLCVQQCGCGGVAVCFARIVSEDVYSSCSPAVVNRLSLRADNIALDLGKTKKFPMSKGRNARAAIAGVHTRPEDTGGAIRETRKNP